MRRGLKEDKELVVAILSESFEENKSVLFAVGKDKNKIPYLIGYSFEKGLNEGDIWLNDEETAVLIALYPHKKKNYLLSLILDIQLLFGVIGLHRLFRILKRERAIKAKQPKSDFIHLWYIGVLNSYQNKGSGSELLGEFLELNKSENRPIYLETSTERNLSFYEKNGFQLKDKIEDELPYTLYLFAKT